MANGDRASCEFFSGHDGATEEGRSGLDTRDPYQADTVRVGHEAEGMLQES